MLEHFYSLNKVPRQSGGQKNRSTKRSKIDQSYSKPQFCTTVGTDFLYISAWCTDYFGSPGPPPRFWMGCREVKNRFFSSPQYLTFNTPKMRLLLSFRAERVTESGADAIKSWTPPCPFSTNHSAILSARKTANATSNVRPCFMVRL